MVRNGTVLLVLSDRNIAKNRLGTCANGGGAIQTRLVDEPALRRQHHCGNRKRPRSAPLCRAVRLWATAIYPYLAYETLARLVDTRAIEKSTVLMLNYRNGINKGRTRSCPKWASRQLHLPLFEAV
jgi:glutamate synthase (NADPH/NADH) large chain